MERRDARARGRQLFRTRCVTRIQRVVCPLLALQTGVLLLDAAVGPENRRNRPASARKERSNGESRLREYLMVEAVSNPESQRMRRARLAGCWYVVAIIVGVLDLMVLPNRFIKPDDAVATAHAILADRGLFQALPVLDIACGTIWLVVVLALVSALT